MNKTLLGDISSIITGPFGSQLHMEDYVEDGIPVIMPQNIKNRTVDETWIARITSDDFLRLNRYATMINDIIYARRGDVEKHAFVKDNSQMLCGTGCLRVRIMSEDIYPPYLSFYLNRPETKRWITSHAVGSNMPNLNTGILEAVPIEYPDYKSQVRIAAVLQKLEEKIDINNKINDYLEEMAKTIYNYWFVQFDFPDKNGNPYKSSGGKMQNISDFGIAPSDWKTGKLYDIANFINGLACQKYRPNENESSLPVIKIREMHEGISVDSERVKADLPQNNIVNTGDILFSWSASLEVQRWAGTTGGLNQHIFKVIPNDGYTSSYVYHQLKAYVVKFIHNGRSKKNYHGTYNQ